MLEISTSTARLFQRLPMVIKAQLVPLRMDPPATPPFKFSTSEPGLLTSNDLITIRRASEEKSRGGTGTFLQRYSHTTCNPPYMRTHESHYMKFCG